MQPKTLVDTNVLLDVLTQDQHWFEWSSAALSSVAEIGGVIINPIILSEVSVGFDTFEGVQQALPPEEFTREALPWDAAFLAGKAFLKYRRSGGARLSPLPDFYIGAHAAVRGYRLLTRDRGRYATYFPSLEVISPA